MGAWKELTACSIQCRPWAPGSPVPRPHPAGRQAPCAAAQLLRVLCTRTLWLLDLQAGWEKALPRLCFILVSLEATAFLLARGHSGCQAGLPCHQPSKRTCWRSVAVTLTTTAAV